MSELVLAESNDTVIVIESLPAQAVEVIERGPQGPQGPQGQQGPQGPVGPPGPNEIGGFPVLITSAKEKDLLQLKSWSWQNTPQESITDGGNF